MPLDSNSDRVSSGPQRSSALPWWRSSTGIVLTTIMLLFLLCGVIMIPRLTNTKVLKVNGLEVLRDIQPTRILVDIDDAKQKARLYLEGIMEMPLGEQYRIYARPWSSDPASRYFVLFENSIDAFYNLKDSYIIREGWRMDVLDKSSGHFPWSVFLDSRGRLLFYQQNLLPGEPRKALSLHQAEALVNKTLSRTVYARIPSFHQVSVTQLPRGKGWEFSFTDSLDHELVSGRPVLKIKVKGAAVTKFWPGLSMPDDDLARLEKATAVTRTMRLISMAFVVILMIRLFMLGIIKMAKKEADMKIFWKLLAVLTPMILYNVYDRFNQLRLWIANPKLPEFSGWILYPAGFGLALFLALHLSWSLKWLNERKIRPDYMPKVAGRIPLINISAALSVLGVILLVANMGLAHMFAGPSETLPIYSNRFSLSFIMFAMYLLVLGFMITVCYRWEKIGPSVPFKIVGGLVGFLALGSVTILSALPLFMGPFRDRALIMILCFIPSAILTALLILYQMRIKSWYLLSLVWLSAPLISEIVAPTHRGGALNFLIIIGLIGIYGWLLLVLGQKEAEEEG